MTHYKVILAGDTGTGKTAQFETFPGRRYAMLFDPAASSTLDVSKLDHDMWFPKATDLALLPRRTAKGRTPKLYTSWAADFNEKLKTGFFEKYDSVMLDSLTLLGQACLDEELSRIDPGKEERTAYRFAGETMVQVFWALTSLPCHVLMTVHTKFGGKEGEAKEHSLTVPGGSKLFMPRFVSALWFTSAIESKDGPSFMALTRPQRMWPHVRTPRAWSDLPLYADMTIKDWSNPGAYGIGALIARKDPTK